MNLKPYPKYKDSGIEWLGEIPEGWGSIKAQYSIHVISGNGFPEHLQGKTDGEYPFLKVSDINLEEKFVDDSNNYVSKEDVIKNKWKVIPRDSILLPKIGEALKKNHRKITKRNCLIDNNMMAIFPKRKYFHNNYLYFLSCIIDMEWFVNPGAVPSVDNSKFRQSILPLPKLSEQVQITNFLDHKTAKIDELIEKNERLIELLREKRQAIISHAVTKGLDPNVKMKDSGIEWIGEIPEGWEIKRLKWIARLEYGSSLSEEAREDGSIPVFGSNGIVGEHSKSITGKPAIIIGRKGSYGKVSYSDVPCFPIDTTYYIDQSLTKENIRWLYYLLISIDLDQITFDTGVPGLSRDFAYDKLIPLPTKNEQTAITNFLDHKTAQIDESIKKIQSQIEKLKEYRQALISNVVTGKVRIAD